MDDTRFDETVTERIAARRRPVASAPLTPDEGAAQEAMLEELGLDPTSSTGPYVEEVYDHTKMTPEGYTREYQDRAAEALRLRRLGLNPADYADDVRITTPGTAGCMPRR